MDQAQRLYEAYDGFEKFGGVRFDQPIPDHILKNINPILVLRPYQINAINRYLHYLDHHEQQSHINLLFNMATGSGKTLIMAMQILDLYKRGYRKFVFFVNRSNIVQKTVDNFTNPASSKYLFADMLEIDGAHPRVLAVENLAAPDSEDIQILFVTIQKMQNDLFTPREGRITLADLTEENIVLLSDEAHHINAWTAGAKLSGEEAEARRTWEQAVQQIFMQNSRNMLLEFTATIDLGNTEINAKYSDKLLYKYDLRQFRSDGYSKEIKLYAVHDNLDERMLQAALISQFRALVAEKHGLLLKPVVLYKSKTINESLANHARFVELIASLTTSKYEQILAAKSNVFERFRNYISDQQLGVDFLVDELKLAFETERIVNVNSTEDAENWQVQINRLEDEDNRIRAIFAVDKLNEGWDVLNLYDIVRLYDTRDGTYSRGGEYKPGKTTTSEAQLIGRGARYWPFAWGQEPVDQRKFDKDLDHDLRLIEELYYHSPRDTDYLIEIRTALVISGAMEQKDPEVVELKLKESFKQHDVYTKGKVYVNALIDNPHGDIKTAMDYLEEIDGIKIHLETHDIYTGSVFESDDLVFRESMWHECAVADIPQHVFEKACCQNYAFFNLANLRRYIPNLHSRTELYHQVSSIPLSIEGNADDLYNMSNETWLVVAKTVCDQLKQAMMREEKPRIGSAVFKPVALKSIFKDTKKLVVEHSDGSAGKSMTHQENEILRLNLETREWYAYRDDFGTSYEKSLVKLIDNHIEAFNKKWKYVYLIRNERDLKLYSFTDGLPFMPDYLLLLSRGDGSSDETYYVFLEPKGQNIADADRWKEEFLLQLGEQAIPQNELNQPEFGIRIIGLPFYQPDQSRDFREQLLNLAS